MLVAYDVIPRLLVRCGPGVMMSSFSALSAYQPRWLAPAAYRPGAGDQRNRPVPVVWQPRPEILAQLGAPVLTERHSVPGRRGLPAKKRCPVVVEIAEAGRHIDRADLHVGQAGSGE